MTSFGVYNSAGYIIRAQDGAIIPPDPSNADYQAAMRAVEAGDTITPYTAPAPSATDVWAEKERRWAAGFNYDFGDERGVHRIGTTDQDMKQWTENVSVLAQAAINLGQPNTRIEIDTDTGSVDVTAAEWQSIIIAAGQFRQPIFQAALALVAMDPIPADYADDSHWP